MTLVERALDLFSPANARPTVAGILPGRGTKTSLTLGFTSLRSHPVPTLRWGCENTIKYFLLHFPHPGAISPMSVISYMITVTLRPFIPSVPHIHSIFSASDSMTSTSKGYSTLRVPVAISTPIIGSWLYLPERSLPVSRIHLPGIDHVTAASRTYATVLPRN